MMRGRWSNTSEPVTIMFREKDPVAIRDTTVITDSMDIPPRLYELLDIVARNVGSDECIGWHNDYIAKQNPDPDDIFKFGKSRFCAQVIVHTGGRDYRRTFRIVNDVPIEHFRLEEIQTK
jgi:hypothetical protein